MVLDPDPNYGPFPGGRSYFQDRDIISHPLFQGIMILFLRAFLVLFGHLDPIWDLMPEGPDLMSDRFPRILMHF